MCKFVVRVQKITNGTGLSETHIPIFLVPALCETYDWPSMGATSIDPSPRPRLIEGKITTLPPYRRQQRTDDLLMTRRMKVLTITKRLTSTSKKAGVLRLSCPILPIWSRKVDALVATGGVMMEQAVVSAQ